MKEKLFGTLSEARAREAELESLCLDGPLDPEGRWAAKDHVAHLAWWRENNSAKTIDAIRTGAEPPARLDDDDVQNAQIYDATRELTAAEIKRIAKRSWEALEGAIGACSEDDLLKEHPRAPGFAVWEMVPAHAGHVGTHVMSCHLDRGDVDAARTVALWAHGVEIEAAGETDKRADADYNLACFYARTGQADEALPLLRASLEAKPELAEWARKDHDLDPIRETVELKELLAT